MRSLIYLFLFKKKHEILDNQNLFKFQSDLAAFFVKTQDTRFFGKNTEAIRPFICGQMQIKNKTTSKAIKNHLKDYEKVVIAKAKEIKPDISNDQIDELVQDLRKNFTRENPEYTTTGTENIFSNISVKTLQELIIVAKANGGSLSYNEFMSSYKNLKNECEHS